MDDSIPGSSTFTKPLDDNDTGRQDHPDESIHRIRGPRDIRKDRDRVDVIDQTDAAPGFMGLGEPHESPKTKYPYRDGIPNTHNASAEYVAGLWLLQQAPERLLIGGLGVKLAATIGVLRDGLNPKVKQRAQSCQAQLKRADIKNMRWKFSVDCGNGAKAVSFKARRPGNITNFHKMDFHVACSCPFWRWQGPEFHSTTKDFQDPNVKLQGTAEAPNVRDIERQNMVCKHIASVLSMTKQWAIPKPKKKAPAKKKKKVVKKRAPAKKKVVKKKTPAKKKAPAKKKIVRKKKAPAKKQARVTEQYEQVLDLMEAVLRPLRQVGMWQVPKEGERERVAQELSKAAKALHDKLYIEFEDSEYGKRVKKKLRKLTNFKKILAAYIKAPTWEKLEPTLKLQGTKSKFPFEKFYGYKEFVMGFIAAVDSEIEGTLSIENYTVTLVTSPRADWDRDSVGRLKEVLARTNRTLASRGLGVVTGGRVFAYPGANLPPSSRRGHSTLASYNIKNDTIQLAAGDVGETHKTLVHELGHRAYFKVLGSNGRSAWEQFFGSNVKPLNVDKLLSNWQRHWENPKDWEAKKYGRYLGYYISSVADEEEKMWLKLVADKVGIEENFQQMTGSPKKGTIPGYDQLLAKKNEVKVFLHPVTAYSGTDAHELFAEVFSLYAVKGPGRIPEIVRHAFGLALPQFKGGATPKMKMEI